MRLIIFISLLFFGCQKADYECRQNVTWEVNGITINERTGDWFDLIGSSLEGTDCKPKFCIGTDTLICVKTECKEK